MSPSWFRTWANFQIENPSVPSDYIVQLAISLKNRYSCLRLENTAKLYSTLNVMECERRYVVRQFSFRFLVWEPASSLGSLGKSHLLLKGLLLWHFREEELEDSPTCWAAGKSYRKELIWSMSLVNYLSLFTVFSQCLWYRVLRKRKKR